MEETNTSETLPGCSGMNDQGASRFQLELSEYGNEVPFKVIKLEQDEVPDIFPASMTQVPVCMGNSDVKNEIICDEYNINMECDDSDTDSECEFMTDSDHLFEQNYGANANGPDALDDADEDNKRRPPTPEWDADQIPRKKIEFTKKQKLRIPPPQTAYEAFRWFLTDDIIENIVQGTNECAARICSHPLIGLKSRFRSWKDVTHEEMITFLGLLLHTGTFRSNRLRDYWKQDYLFNWACFSQYIKQDRFMAILSCLNFASSTDALDVIGKIRPMIENFNKKMTEIYYPAKKLFLANPVVLWNGRFVRQKHRDCRRHKNVIKLHMLAEPDGTILKYDVYFNNINHNLKRLTTGEIVKGLLEDYVGNGHVVYMNKCYSSWKLASELLDQRTYCTAILCKKSKDSLSACNQSNQTFFLDGVQIGKWDHNNKSVLYISTELEYSSKQVTDKCGIKKTTPTVIMNYCKYMADSELQEQLMLYYPCNRKYLRWNKKLLLQSLQIYIRSAFRLYNYSRQKKLYHYDFRLAILKAMLPEIISAPVVVSQPHALTKITKTRIRRRKYKSDNSIRDAIEFQRKKCYYCRVKRKKEAKTFYECLGCVGEPGFCPGSCFDEAHANLPVQEKTPPLPQ